MEKSSPTPGRAAPKKCENHSQYLPEEMSLLQLNDSFHRNLFSGIFCTGWSARALAPEDNLLSQKLSGGGMCLVLAAESQIRAAAAAAAARSDRPATFSRLTPNSWLLSEHVQPFQALPTSRVRAAGEVCWEPQGSIPLRRAPCLPTKLLCFAFGAVKRHCKCLINDIPSTVHDGSDLIPIKPVPAPTKNPLSALHWVMLFPMTAQSQGVLELQDLNALCKLNNFRSSITPARSPQPESVHQPCALNSTWHFSGEEMLALTHRSQGTPVPVSWSCFRLPLCQFTFLTPGNTSTSFILQPGNSCAEGKARSEGAGL